jgi:CHAD domain-containing protein
MRIGVRRLRSCLALAEGMAPAKSLDDLRAQTRWVLDALGPARDLDVFADQTLPAVLADLARAESEALAWVVQLKRGAERRRRSADDAALACVSSPRFTRFVLAADSVAGALRIATGGEAHARARKFAARIIDKRARRLAKAGENLAHASIDARHAARIAAKKLRYATEFFATLFPRRRTKAYRDALAGLQDALGAFNDAAIASRVAGVLAGPTAPATVAIEAWSAARIDQCAKAIDTAWARYAKARAFWTRD